MSIDNRIPADIIDRTRREVRERAYRNSTEESEEIRRVDDEMARRVSDARDQTVAQTQSFIHTNATRVGAALDLVDDLENIGQRLARGGDTTELAKEYRAVKSRLDTELGRLGRMIEEVNGLDAALEDPVANAQRLYALMPARSWIAP